MTRTVNGTGHPRLAQASYRSLFKQTQTIYTSQSRSRDSRPIDQPVLELSSSNYIDDTPEFRRMVFYSFLLSYFFAFLSLCTLPLLPSQRAEAQARKKAWDKSDAYAWTSVVLISVGLVYSVTINFLAMFPSTMCLRIAGGNGCG